MKMKLGTKSSFDDKSHQPVDYFAFPDNRRIMLV